MSDDATSTAPAPATPAPSNGHSATTASSAGHSAAPAPSAGHPAARGETSFARRIATAGLWSLAAAAILVAVSGHDPAVAFRAMIVGALGSPHQIGVALDRTTPYLLAGAGVALCFRAGVINMGAEGQIALGGAGATAAALVSPTGSPLVAIVLSLAAGALCGAAWSALAAAIHLGRRVHEVLVTLMLNFVGLLGVQQILAGPLGQVGAGFLQSPPLPREDRLAGLPFVDAHVGFLVAVAAAGVLSFVLWRTPFGFSLRVAGASRRAAAYAGFSLPGLTFATMTVSGALSGLAGGIEVLGVHHRLIEGFSTGFGFKAVTVALLGAIEPLAVVPAALFVGLLETGALSMQRQIGVPSSLVVVIEAITMLFVLAATVRRS